MSEHQKCEVPISDIRLSRRELLKVGGALGASAAAAAAISTPAAAAEAKIPRAVLGRTGMKVSRLGFGGAWDIEDEVIGTGFDLGINYIDTAESYRDGRSEVRFGEILKAKGATGHSAIRKKLWLVSKTHNHNRLEQQLPGSLERLQQDYLDVYYMHQVQNPEMAAQADIKAAAERMKKSGKIRFFGFSCHDGLVVECLNAAADSGFIDVIMFRYDCHYYKRDDLNRAIDRCVKANIGLVAMKTQVGGMTLPDRYNPFKQRGLSQHTSSIKAVAMDERIASICSEMTNVNMIRENAIAVASKLTTAEADAIQEHAQLVSHLWCRGCDHICRPASGSGSQLAIADSLRFLMYHDHYGKKEHARDLYAKLPESERNMIALESADWQAAESACPHNVPLGKLMNRVKERLA